jgi:23S rRNA (cytidine1920-2'-O)/16S rRNA (cytidine1409-2'-O)-methyltransferase
MSPVRVRLDKLLVDRGLARSREFARAAIMGGKVFVRGERIDKPGAAVPPEADLRVDLAELPYVSRGGQKLEGALDRFGIDPSGSVCLDAGISTGGFTDCLLQRGAARVYGIDVGYGQVALKLRDDPRVVLFERTNIRHFDPASISEPIDLTVADLAFISLTLVLAKLRDLTRPGGTLLVLVKPQFEVGKGEVGKGGVVRDADKQAAAVARVAAFAGDVGLAVGGETPSPILGPKGNREFFLLLRKD